MLSGPLKRSIIARIATLGLADPGDLGDTVQVSTAMQPNPERKAVFVSRTSWGQRDVLAERYVAYEQTIVVEVRVRVMQPGGDMDATEREAERIVSLIVAGVCADPDLTGGRGRIVATSGDADPVVLSPSPDPYVVVNLGLVFTATLNVMGA